MKRVGKRIVLSVVAFLFVLIFTLALLPRNFALVWAENEYNEAFFSRANTFSATSIEEKTENGNTYYKINYDMNNRRTEAKVSTAAPQVTFVTHGLNGNGGDWSNDGTERKFAYMEGSILERFPDSNLYLADFKDVDGADGKRFERR